MLDYDLAEAIVNKYHRGAKRAGLVWTSYDYAVKKGLYPEEADDYDFDDSLLPEWQEHGIAIQEVMTLEVSFWVFRNLNGAWGEVCDELIRLRNNRIYEYHEKTGFHIDINSDVFPSEV